jgi:hypothetical protein
LTLPLSVVVLLQWYSGTLFMYTFLFAFLHIILNLLNEKNDKEGGSTDARHLTVLTDILQILGGCQGMIDFGLWMIYNHKEVSCAALLSSDTLAMEDDKEDDDHWEMYVKDLRRAIIVYATKVLIVYATKVLW